MNNYTMRTADRLTHLKIVVMSLVAGIVVVDRRHRCPAEPARHEHAA